MVWGRSSTSILRKKMFVGLWVWWVLIEESMAMGLMRSTANGSPFLGCRGWMWVICVKSVVWGRRSILRKKMSVGLWVWWAFRCDAMLCGWFALGLIKEELVEEELVEEGKEEMANHCERERKSIVKGKAFEYRVYHVFWLVFFFFFLVLWWRGKLWEFQRFRLYIYI